MISVALLRGINVGGQRKIPMAELRQWLHDASLADVQTYIQSGNVVIVHAASLDVATTVHDAILDNSGWDVPVIVRSAHELSDIVESNPYPHSPPTQLHVSFLSSAPDDAAVLESRARDWGVEEFTILGRDVYLHLPSGMGKSVMVPRLKLLKEATTRNWNTVLALVEMSTR